MVSLMVGEELYSKPRYLNLISYIYFEKYQTILTLEFLTFHDPADWDLYTDYEDESISYCPWEKDQDYWEG